ncbi:MAG: hypothetical protein EBR82_46975 [Caulobacteraceae bacterium]|nr:hypothetical protein [Caulobacteraceae bacterium]NDG19140.1 hypothetical protein [Betaproteobacteria bacterium]
MNPFLASIENANTVSGAWRKVFSTEQGYRRGCEIRAWSSNGNNIFVTMVPKGTPSASYPAIPDPTTASAAERNVRKVIYAGDSLRLDADGGQNVDILVIAADTTSILYYTATELI